MKALTASSLTGLALLALTGCGESVSNRLMAPTDGPSATKAGTPIMRGLTSSAGVVPTAYDGNTSGDGSSSCSALGFGSTGTKVDGAYSQKVGGYQFTVSGSEKQYLAFAPSGTPTSTILAVIVKGGDAYEVYNYRNNPRTSDAGLTSPYNHGGNIPTISHYVVCYGPYTPPIFTKTLVGVMKEGATIGSMEDDLSWRDHPDLVIIPWGRTRWLDWQLSYTLPPGVTGIITENATTVCGSLGTFRLQCTFNENPATYPIYTWSGLSGQGAVLVMNDLGGGGAGSCGDHDYTNTATLALSNGTTLTASKTITVRVVCPTTP